MMMEEGEGVLFEKLSSTLGRECNQVLKKYQDQSLSGQELRGKYDAEIQVLCLSALMQEEVKQALSQVFSEAVVEMEVPEQEIGELPNLDMFVERIVTLTAISIVYTFNPDFPLSEIREKYTLWRWIDEVIEDVERMRQQKQAEKSKKARKQKTS